MPSSYVSGSRRSPTAAASAPKTVSIWKSHGASFCLPFQSISHSIPFHCLERGHAFRTSQELLGHSNVKTAMFETPLLNRGPCGVTSPGGMLDQREHLVFGPAYALVSDGSTSAEAFC